MNGDLVGGCCPMGCGETLALRDGQIACLGTDCPEPAAVATILADPETDHLVRINETSFSVRHPLRERLADALLTCGLTAQLGRDVPVPGAYRASWSDKRRRWLFVKEE